VTQVECAGLETYAAIEQFRSLPSWIAQLGRPAARSNKVQHTQQPEVLINHGHVSFSWSVTFHFKKLIKLASGSVSSSLCRYYLHYTPNSYDKIPLQSTVLCQGLPVDKIGTPNGALCQRQVRTPDVLLGSFGA
jgi:hypothetical protein